MICSRPFSERRGGDGINLAAIARDYTKVEDATSRMECSHAAKAQFAVEFGERF
jgi:hypothetical protein